MKKLLFISLLISLGFNFYLYKSQYVIVDDFADDQLDQIPAQEPMNDQVKLAQSSIKKTTDCESLNKKKSLPHQKALKTTPYMEQDQDEEFSDLRDDVLRRKMEESYDQWLVKSDNFFYEDLRLSREQVARYRELSAQRQQEISQYFELKRASSDDSNAQAYLFTTEDTIFMGNLAQKYERLLKENFGEKNYRRHKKFIKRHNAQVMSDEFVQVVEF